MREALLLAIALTAFVGAGFVPGGVVDSVTENAARAVGPEQVARAGKPQEKDRYAAWVAGSTTLPRQADGHFYADAAVNGRTTRFLVDTGASVVALTGPDAAAAGIQWSPTDVRPVASGASGPVYGVTVKLDRIALGGHERYDVAAIVVPEGLGISLLGQSFLSGIEPVRIESDRMILGQ